MAYVNEGIDQRAEVALGLSDSLTYYARRDGAPETVSAVTVRVLSPSGEVLVASTSSGVTTSTNAITFTQTWLSTVYQLWEDYVLELSWTGGGLARSDRMFFDVVKSKLQCPLELNQVQELYPDIASHLAAVGESDCSKAIKRAWSIMLDRIRSGRNRPSLILDRARLVNPALQLATSIVCGWLTRETDDIWDKRCERHLKSYETLMAGLGELKYDKDEDGLAGDDETKAINRRTFSV